MKLLDILESLDSPHPVVNQVIIDAVTQVFDQSVCYYFFNLFLL